MQKKLKILISAYACGPNRGSEPGMGWNFVTELSKHHNVHVITEQYEFKASIEAYAAQNENVTNINFHYIPVIKKNFLRKIWPPSYYWFYKKWQKEAFKLAVDLDTQFNFDIVHQLNMVGYREPGYLWKIKKPFVWGPIGGLENSPWSFLPSLGFKGFVFYTFRNFINYMQRLFSARPRYAVKRENMALVSATKNNALIAKSIWSKESTIISEVGQSIGNGEQTNMPRIGNDPIKIVWSGVHTPRKNLPLLLKALKNISIPYELHVVGEGEMTSSWKEKAIKYGINTIIWHGWVQKERAMQIMSEGHVFVLTSISDLTATVTLEALSLGLPIICLDHCGFTDVVTDQCGIKITVENPKAAALELENAIVKLYNNEAFRCRLSTGAKIRAAKYTWEEKIDKLTNIYNQLLDGK